MTQLKTLKNLDTNKRVDNIKIKVLNPLLNNAMTIEERNWFIIGQKIEKDEFNKQIKAEAIKWIKNRIKQCEDCFKFDSDIRYSL